MSNSYRSRRRHRQIWFWTKEEQEQEEIVTTRTETRKKTKKSLHILDEEPFDPWINDSRLERHLRESRATNDDRALTVRRNIDFIGHFSDLYFEPFLYFIKNSRIAFISDIGDCQTFRTESTSTSNLNNKRILSILSHVKNGAYSMEIRVGTLRHVVIEDDVHSLDIHTSTEEIRSHENTRLEFFEFLVTSQTRKSIELVKIFCTVLAESNDEPIFLSHATMNFHGRKVLLGEQLAQCCTTWDRFDEDHHLIEFEFVE